MTSSSPFADQSDDRDAAPQYVLPLVVRIERDGAGRRVGRVRA